MNTYTDLDALLEVTDINSPDYDRRALISMAQTNPLFKFTNLTGTYNGLDENGNPIITVPNTGQGYPQISARPGTHSADTWRFWRGFNFSKLTVGQCYFFLCVEDPREMTKKGRPIRYPVLLVTEKLTGGFEKNWSKSHNDMCFLPAAEVLEGAKVINNRWKNHPSYPKF